MDLGAKASSKFIGLISEVEAKLGQPLPFEVVEEFEGKEDAHLDTRGKIPVVRILNRKYNVNAEQELTFETERLIAHELLHLKCKQEGYPGVGFNRLLFDKDVATNYLRNIIATIVEHKYVYTELERLGFPANETDSEILERTLKEKCITDYPKPYQHFQQAFHIAETLIYHKYSPSLVEYLLEHLPNIYKTTQQIVDVVKDIPLGPASARQTLIRLVHLIDKLNPELRPPAAKRFIIGLVFPEDQLKRPAREMVRVDQNDISKRNIYMLMLAYTVDDFYFGGMEQTKPFENKVVKEISKAIGKKSFKGFLEKYNIPYKAV